MFHYKYHGNVLVITVIAARRGETKETEDEITSRYTEFGVGLFKVESMLASEGFDH